VERDRRGRRLSERDRHGTPLATLAWSDDGRLSEAVLRIPNASWLRVVPRSGHDPRWGVSDVVHYGGAAVTHFAAVDWSAIDAIPPLAEPARLPPGGGTAILNLIANLAEDQGRRWLEYRGPYPTEQLFLALLECFRYEPATPGAARSLEEDPDASTEHPSVLFMAGDLVWAPDPHERCFDPRGVYVQTRGESSPRVEKVVWRGRAYYRERWQAIERHAAHRVRDDGERVVCSLWVLGEALEDHVVLSRAGDVLEIRTPVAPAAEPPRPMASATVAGVIAIVIAGSAPPLAEAIRAVAGALVFEWASLDGDLAAVGDGRTQVSRALLRALAARLVAAGSRAEQVRVGFAALTEAAHAVGDGLRARAQARLAAADAGVQAEALARTARDVAAAARQIGEGVERLLEEAAQLRA
jgi:hypothetical protein